MTNGFSPVIAGTIRWGSWGAKLSSAKMAALMEDCLEIGVDTFDHADVNGNYTTEKEFGAALSESGMDRSKIKIIVKSGIVKPCSEKPQFTISHYNSSKAYIIDSVHQSLINLNTDYLDMYMIHRGSPLLHFEEIAEAFHELQQAGKVRSFGVSDFSHTQIRAMNRFFPVTSCQMEVSMLQNEAMYDGRLDVCMELDITPVSWSPIGGEAIFAASKNGKKRFEKLEQVASKYNWTVTEMGLLFLLHHPARILPVVNAPKIQKIKEFTDLLHTKITNEQWFEILRVIRGEDVS